ncbi:hypothetical protein CYR32_14900 [Chimaeribacter coloradensis]|uniref:Uncharacterized protein n=1 Tax=Chimaeribacter coloradensis TaxID=2060068 RepID=A0A2N5DYM9_9GAMM|nr:hypothetical protein [Chimaeribacter coloradensis]PLR32662.1 hypothetical protein CYR32_14900 [Chimaeribacter coloradensis]
MSWEKGGAVLLGVIITLIVTILKEAISAFLKRKAERAHVTVQLVLLLDQFASECASVAGDDGTWLGQRDKDGGLRAQVDEPKLDYSGIKGEWKSLWPNLIYQVHDLALQQTYADQTIRNDFEESSPPDDNLSFETRQYEYARLGLKAYAIASDLRDRAGLPQRTWNSWNPISYLRETVQRIDERRQVLAMFHQGLLGKDKI